MAEGDSNRIPNYPLNDIGRKLVELFTTSGNKCDFVVRAPGRVNLIGEHIDYNGYPVLPMALEQAIHIAVGPSSEADKIILESTDPNYSPFTISIEQALKFGSDAPSKPLQWYHYFLCAYRGIADYVERMGWTWNPPSLKILVGNVDYGGLWPAAGISSSSAFVVASSIAVMHKARLQIGRRELAGLCAECERYTGMQGGGMDQAASLLAMENNALLIEFTKPLVTVHPVSLPSDLVFVIAHTGVHARKAATSHYNERVSECRLAAKILALNCPNKSNSSDLRTPLTLGDAQKLWTNSGPGQMLETCDNNNKVSIIEKYLPTNEVSIADLLKLGLNPTDIDLCLTPTTKTMNQFRLFDRAKHVYSEAERVFRFHDLCKQIHMNKSDEGGDTIDPVLSNKCLVELGQLMNQSQESCAKLYECSCPELDQLISIARSAGASGSRLTGAGWGGCTVSLVRKSDAEKFMQQVKEQYYIPRGLDLTNCPIFVSQPGAPAGIMPVQ